MIKKSFFGTMKPRLEYAAIDVTPPAPQKIPASSSVQLLANAALEPGDTPLLKTGDSVKAGQKLTLFDGRDAYITAPVSGTITAIAPFTGDFGARLTAITIEVSEKKEIDDQFKAIAPSPTLENAKEYLCCLPGRFPLSLLSDAGQAITTILVMGVDRDLLTMTQQFVVKTKTDAVKAGIQALEKITGIEKFVIAVPETLSQDAVSTGAAVKMVSSIYPAAAPHLILRDVLGEEIPAGKSFEDMGVAVMSAEAVASIGTAYSSGQIPAEKLLTVIDKAGRANLVSAVIGTPLKDIFTALNITANNEDRVIVGGPMTGASVYTENHPVCENTDAVMIQDKSIIPLVSDAACINCGECIRACPANVPVNMLVRFLEIGQFMEGADGYDLYSCIECGLCSYVCTARMPILQYIKLAKYELARIQKAEAENV